jgi:hypothetical protein
VLAGETSDARADAGEISNSNGSSKSTNPNAGSGEESGSKPAS